MKHGRRFFIVTLATAVLAVALALLAAGGHRARAQGTIIYVDLDAVGVNNGSTWGNAFTDLQDALDVAGTGDQIWVAEGTYRPAVPHGGTGDRYKSFQMVNNVAIYGGFAGTENQLQQRDTVNNLTVLSGDLNGDDGPGFANNSENSYHVFYHPEGTNLNGTAILDGFAITGGNANGIPPHDQGGGVYNGGGSSPSLTNCAFLYNAARDGGGMHNYHSSPTLANCTFEGNRVWRGGGGIYNSQFAAPTLTNCSFIGNSAGYGGGMRNHESSPVLTNCTFSGNLAEFGGGGIRNEVASSPVLTSCTFSGNSAGWGGGMSNKDSSPTLIYCTFSGNSAEYGGGMSNYGGSPALTNCTFSGNWAESGGGGMENVESSSMLTNCTFWDNSARYGGGMANDRFASPTLINCTFSGNSAENGGGVINLNESSPTLTNCILWADVGSEISNQGSSPIVTYSDVEGGYPGTGNIDVDPSFVDAGNGDFHLQLGSPCIDAGNNQLSNLPPCDFEGDDRVQDGNGDGWSVVDMGVDEAPGYMPFPFWVEVEITPNLATNIIRLYSRAKVPVAILTTDEFHAGEVAPDTVVFAGATHVGFEYEDVNDDGDLDLLLYFRAQELELDAGITEATLTGETLEGVPIEGADTVRVIVRDDRP